MKYEVDEQKKKEGVEEIFKEGLNNIESYLEMRVELIKEQVNLGETPNSTDEFYKAKGLYNVSHLGHYLDKRTLNKYEAEADKIVQEKIDEVNNYITQKN
jgi:hypothetical protein